MQYLGIVVMISSSDLRADFFVRACDSVVLLLF